MGLSFVETMRGWMRDGDGREHPVSFEVHAKSRGRGAFRLEGLVSAPPWIPNGVLKGSLAIAPGLKALRYRLRLLAGSGEVYMLEGEKHPSLLVPIHSMTVMTASLRDGEGSLLATGTMAFDLLDVGAFAASWLRLRGRAERELEVERRLLERRMLDAGGYDRLHGWIGIQHEVD